MKIVNQLKGKTESGSMALKGYIGTNEYFKDLKNILK
jgi:hypothetical protein